MLFGVKVGKAAIEPKKEPTKKKVSKPCTFLRINNLILGLKSKNFLAQKIIYPKEFNNSYVFYVINVVIN